MNTDLINHLASFLSSSELGISFPQERVVKYNKDGTETVGSSVSDYLFKQTINMASDNYVVGNLLIFYLFDSYLDNKYEELSGKSFAAKYRELPIDSDLDKIIKEIFRLLKLIRNTLTHNLKGITVENDIYRYNYEFKNTEFNLRINEENLKLLYTLVILLAKGNSYYNLSYYNGLLRFYYDELKGYIDKSGELHDEFTEENGQLLKLSNEIRLCYKLRYKVVNAKYSINKNKIIIEKYDPQFGYKVDYIINYKDNDYVLPCEILDDSYSIDISEIKDWKITYNA